jgi:glycerol-3-phosphate dehydrogenase
LRFCLSFLTPGSYLILQARLLNGQKLQGTITAKDVQLVLKHYGCQKEFPLFDAVYRIAFEGAPPAETLFEQWGLWHARCKQAGLSLSDD